MKTILLLALMLPVGVFAAGYSDSTGNKPSGHTRQATGVLKPETRTFKQADRLLNHLADAKVAGPEFTDPFLQTNYPVSTKTQQNRRTAEKVFEEIENSGHYTDDIAPDALVNLPVGLKWGPVTVGVQKVKLYATYSELTLFCKIDFNGKTLYFGADNIKLSRQGGFIGSARLVLLGDYPISLDSGQWVMTFKGGMDMSSGQGDAKTYISIDCAGFKELSIAGEVAFPRKLLLPVDEKYTIIKDPRKKVTGTFHTVVTAANNLADFIVDATFNNAFRIVKSEDLAIIKIEHAIFDFSVTKNSSFVKFPENCTCQEEADHTGLWQGVYLEKVAVILPPEFGNTEPGDSSRQLAGFEASNILIDRTGITGMFELNNAISVPLPGGWAMTVNNWYMNVAHNALTDGGFSGGLRLPVGENLLGYKASFNDGKNWLIRVSNEKALSVTAFMASAELEPNSFIELARKNGRFIPKAVLNGRLGIVVNKGDKKDSTGKPITTINGLEFQNLTITSVAPYIQADYFGYKEKIGLEGFPVSLSEIGLFGRDKEVGIGFGIDVNLMAGKITANSKMAVVARFNEDKEQPGWEFDRFELQKLKIESDFGAFSIKGSVQANRNHPILGTGFEGTVGGVLKLGEKSIGIDIKAGFGCKEEAAAPYSYWYADGLVSGLNIPLNGLTITRLGLGIGFHVNRAADVATDTSASPLGMGYVPAAGTGLYVRGMAGFNFLADNVATAEASLDIQFTPSWGFQSAGFFGKAYVMPASSLTGFFKDAAAAKKQVIEKIKSVEKKIAASNAVYSALSKLGNFGKMNELAGPAKEEEQNSEAIMTALLVMNYDHANRVFHANLDVYANVPGGLVTGAGSNGRAGWGEIDANFRSGKFYAYFGTPEDPIGLKANFALLGNTAEAYIKTYFMAGNVLPAPSPLNPLIADKFPGIDLNENRDMGALCNGQGIAFGTELNSRINVNLPIVYYNFNLLAGFDMTFKHYADLYCGSTNSQVGFNGWQGRGDLYAYLQGELGIKISLFKIFTKEIPLINGSAACILQAQFPNPAWAQGMLNLEISSPVLSQLRGMNISFNSGAIPIGPLGQKCDPVNNNSTAQGLSESIIAGISPAHQATGVDVFAVPQVIFNKNVGQVFQADEEGNIKSYRFGLQSFSLVKSDGQPLAGHIKLNPRGTDAVFECAEILPPNTTLKAIAEVAFEEWKEGEWQAVFNNGQKVTELKEVEFTTGTAPMVIPMQNISYSYPASGQKNFYPREHIAAGINRGYIQLNRGQSYLFGDTTQELRAEFIMANRQDTIRNTFYYDGDARKVWFNLPVLTTGESYSFRLVRLPKDAGTDNIVTETRTIETELGSMQVTENRAEGMLSQNIVHEFLGYDFATSRFNTFREKMQQKILKKAQYEIVSADVGHLQADVYGQEAFDLTELAGTAYTGNQPLIQPQAMLTDAWYTGDIEPLIYRDYPLATDVTVNRDTTQYGLLPVRAVQAMGWYTYMVTANSTDRLLQERLPHRYELAATYNRDFRDLQYKAVNKYVNNPHSFPAVLQKYLDGVFPSMRMGSYRVLFQYRLPGGEKGSTHTFEYINSLN